MVGQISTLGDMYSYGIFLLEMFTGKRPIDEMFNDGLSIHRFIAMALPENVMNIVDPSMFLERGNEDVDDENHENDIEESAIIEDHHVNISSRIKDFLITVFQIGLSCSSTLSNERMPANVVVKEMTTVRDTFLKFNRGNRRRRRMS